MEKAPGILRINDSVSTVMNLFEKTGASTLPVLNEDDTFVGFISKTKLYSYYRQVMVDFSEE